MMKKRHAEKREVAYHNSASLWSYECDGTNICVQRQGVVIVLKKDDSLSFHLVQDISGTLGLHHGSIFRIWIWV